MNTKITLNNALQPCPLCGGIARDIGHGISCEDCGLWLGDGTQAHRMGGYKAVWNLRATKLPSAVITQKPKNQ